MTGHTKTDHGLVIVLTSESTGMIVKARLTLMDADPELASELDAGFRHVAGTMTAERAMRCLGDLLPCIHAVRDWRLAGPDVLVKALEADR